jgi:hypothetical protein
MMAVREAIAIDPKLFDMGYWKSSCGTTLCIAGHLAVLRAEKFVIFREAFPDLVNHPHMAKPEATWLPNSFFESIGISKDHWLWHLGEWPEDLREEYYSSDDRGSCMVSAGQKAIDRWALEEYTPEEIAQAKAGCGLQLKDLIGARALELTS